MKEILSIEQLFQIIRDKHILSDTNSTIVVVDQDLHVCYINDKSLQDGAPLCPGDLLHCVNATSGESGCGSHEFCTLCKLRGTVTRSLQDNVKTEGDTTLLLEGNSELNAHIYSTPVSVEGRQYAIVMLVDTTTKTREMLMERIFFHDILNLAGAMNNCFECIDDTNRDTMMALLSNISHELIDELISQRALIYAQKGMLETVSEDISIQQIIDYTKESVKPMLARMNKQLTVETDISDEHITSDRNLIHRVLLNMIKNAGESNASADATITLRVHATDTHITFSVHNNGEIPADMKPNIFRYGNSTKGVGRGLGTYSMKLIGENYLHGQVWFTSTETEGTEFFLSIPR